MSSYSPAEIEAKWQEAWAEAETFKAVATADRPKYYVLEMFPYPWAAFTWAMYAITPWAM